MGRENLQRLDVNRCLELAGNIQWNEPHSVPLPTRWGYVLARQPRVDQERGIYPAGTPALEIRAGIFKAPSAAQPSCGLKSALRSLAQRPR